MHAPCQLVLPICHLPCPFGPSTPRRFAPQRPGRRRRRVLLLVWVWARGGRRHCGGAHACRHCPLQGRRDEPEQSASRVSPARAFAGRSRHENRAAARVRVDCFVRPRPAPIRATTPQGTAQPGACARSHTPQRTGVVPFSAPPPAHRAPALPGPRPDAVAALACGPKVTRSARPSPQPPKASRLTPVSFSTGFFLTSAASLLASS